ncbi:MAG: sugar ABC transporter permease [Opitutaceae bacterium]
MTGAEKSRLIRGLLFISPWLLGFLIFSAYPLVATAVFSLTDYSVLSKPVYIGSSNYTDLATDPLFWKALSNTMLFAFLAVPLNTVVACFLAILLNFNIRGKGVFRTIFFLPSLVPLVCLAIVWRWLLNGELGLINTALTPFFEAVNATFGTGFRPPNWLQEAAFTKPGLVLAGLWGVGHAMVIYLAGLQEAPVEYYEAAEIDGAGFWQKLFKVTLPLLSPYIFFNLIMGIIGTLQIFAVPYVMMGGTGGTDGIAGPERSMLFIATYIYQNAFDFWNMGYACAISLIFFIIVLILTLFVVRMSERRVHYD